MSVAVLVEKQIVNLPNPNAITQFVGRLDVQIPRPGQLDAYVTAIRQHAAHMVEESKQEHYVQLQVYQDNLRQQVQSYVHATQTEFEALRNQLLEAETRAIGSMEGELRLTTAYEQHYQKMCSNHLDLSAELMKSRSALSCVRPNFNAWSLKL